MRNIPHFLLCLICSVALSSCNSDDGNQAADSPGQDKTLDPNAESTVLTVIGMN